MFADVRIPVLDTPRVRLRPLAEDDAAFLAALDMDAEVMRYVHGGALAPDLAVRYAGLQVQMAEYRHRFGRWLVERRDTAERLGWLELFKLAGPRRDDIQAGYQFASAAQGHGYATEALRAAVDYAFGPRARLDRLAAIVRPENERSRRLLARCGFLPSGEFRPDGAGHACELWFHHGPSSHPDCPR